MTDQSKTFTSEQIEHAIQDAGISQFEIERTFDNLEG